MLRSVVSVETGCKSVRLAADGIQVYAKSGLVHITWRDVKAAALAGRDRREMPKHAEMVELMKPAQDQVEAAGVTAELIHKMQQSVLDRDGLMKIVRNGLAAQWLGEEITGPGDHQQMQMPAGIVEQMQKARSRMESAGIAADPIGRLQSQMESMGVSADWTGKLREQIELQSTHDALWIVRRDEIICVLIEESGPERDALLTGLRANLGRRWLGDDFTWQQLENRFCRWGFRRTFLTLRTIVVMLSALVLFMIVSTLVLYALPIATGQLVGAVFAALMAGEWTAALICAVAFAVCLFLCFVVDRKIRRWRNQRYCTRL